MCISYFLLYKNYNFSNGWLKTVEVSKRNYELTNWVVSFLQELQNILWKICFRFWIVIFLIVTFHNLSPFIFSENACRKNDYVKICPNFWPYKLFLELHFPSMQWKGLIYNTVAINQFLEVMFPFFYTYNDVELFICYDVIGSKNYVSDQKMICMYSRDIHIYFLSNHIVYKRSYGHCFAKSELYAYTYKNIL